MAKKRQDSIKIKFRFRSERQEEAWRCIDDHDVTFLSGPAGTAKTFLACAYAAKYAVEFRDYENIFIMRPTVEAGEQVGFLPGNLDAKVKPFLSPVYTIMDTLANGDTALRSAILARTHVKALGYLRGCTFESTIVVVDEAQNVRLPQMRLILSRMGENSKVIFSGDVRQSDIPNSPLVHCANHLSELDEIGLFAFGPEDNCRLPLVNDILDVLDNMPALPPFDTRRTPRST